MIKRLVWFALLAAVALVTIGAQADRQSRHMPQLAAMVPAPFRGFAEQRLAEQAVMAKNGPAASRHATALVRNRPLPAEHIVLLSQAAALEGDNPSALAALAAANLRGWRDPVVQFTAGQAALAQGQHEAAAQRLAALFATGALPEQAQVLLAQLLVEPQGRAAFAEQLAAGTRWQRNVLAPAAGTANPEDLAQTIALAQARGAEFSCEQLARIARGHEATGHAAAAQRFWPGECPATS